MTTPWLGSIPHHSPRHGSSLWAVAALVTTMTGGCHVFEDECSEGDRRCQGNSLEVCRQSDETGTKYFGLSEECDQIAGHTCRTSTTSATGLASATCVSDEPCTTSACAGEVAVLCHPSGFIESRTDCAAQSGEICAVGGSKAGCVYPVSCPATDSDRFCDGDGHRIWSGCRAGYGYPTAGSDCAGKGLACASGNGVAECVLTQRITCNARSDFAFCSPDASSVYFCGPSGYVDDSSACDTAGAACKMTVDGNSSSTGCSKL